MMIMVMIALIAYAVAAPDRGTLAVTRGAAGALRGATGAYRATRPIRITSGPRTTRAGASGNRVSGRGRRTPGATGASAAPPVARQQPAGRASVITAAAVTGARTSSRVALDRRAAGTDRTTRAAGAAQRQLTKVAAGIAAGGLATAITPRTTQPAPAVTSGQCGCCGMNHGRGVATGEHCDWCTTHTAQDLEQETPMTENTTIGGTDLASLSDLRSEIDDGTGRLGEATELVTALRDWSSSLSERYSGAGFQTDGLGGAVSAAMEAFSALPDMEDLAELLADVEDEIRKAEQLGEIADELGADGDVQAFRAS